MSDLFDTARAELKDLLEGSENGEITTPEAAFVAMHRRIDAMSAELAEARATTAALVGLAERLIDANQRLREAQDTRRVGRPLKASPAEAAQAQALHSDGLSLRAISAETGLSLRTVRTIVARAKDKAEPAEALVPDRPAKRKRAHG